MVVGAAMGSASWLGQVGMCPPGGHATGRHAKASLLRLALVLLLEIKKT